MKKSHRILELQLEPILKSYIKSNKDVQRGEEKVGNKTKQKVNAKLRNIALFGKSIEKKNRYSVRGIKIEKCRINFIKI